MNKKKAKLMQKILEYQYKDVDMKFMEKVRKLEKIQREANPLDLWKVWWKK